MAHRLSSYGMWDLGSPNGDQTHVPHVARWILNHWATREVPRALVYGMLVMCTMKVADNSDLNVGSATHSLCDLEQATLPL